MQKMKVFLWTNIESLLLKWKSKVLKNIYVTFHVRKKRSKNIYVYVLIRARVTVGRLSHSLMILVIYRGWLHWNKMSRRRVIFLWIYFLYSLDFRTALFYIQNINNESQWREYKMEHKQTNEPNLQMNNITTLKEREKGTNLLWKTVFYYIH